MPSFYLGALFRKSLDYVLDKTTLQPIVGRPDWQITRALFEAAGREAEAAGASFVLIYIPFGVGEHPSAIERAVVDWSRDTETHLVNMREVFAAQPLEEWGDFYDGHWTARGHEVAAEAVNQFIRDAELLQ
jgi:hypothetical protein